MSYSLKTLFGVVTLLAISLVVYQKLHDKYYLVKLNQHIEVGDGCSVIELLQYGHDQGFRPSWADSALINAAKLGNCHTLSHFRHTTDWNRKVFEGQTPLMIAAANGHFNAVKFLLVENARTRLRDLNGFTAIDLARLSGHLEIAALISAAEQDTWGHVLEMETVLFFLRSDAHIDLEAKIDRDEIEKLFLLEKYAALTEYLIRSPIEGDESGYWFQLSDRICIGMVGTFDGTYRSIDFQWVIDDMHVSGVRYFYPDFYFD